MVAYKLCGIRHIRQSMVSCGFSIKAFFEEQIDQNLDRMKNVQPDADALQMVDIFYVGS